MSLTICRFCAVYLVHLDRVEPLFGLFVLFLIFVVLAFDLYWQYLFIMVVAKSFEIILETLFSLSAVSEKIGMPSPPHAGGKDSSFLSMPEQLTPLDTAGMRSVLTISPIFLVGC